MNKRSLVILFSLVSVVASYFAFAALPVNADASTQKCYQYAVSVNNPSSNPGTVNLDLHDFSPITNSYHASYSVKAGETRTVSVQGLFPLGAGSFAGSVSGVNVNYVSLVHFGTINFDLCAGFGHIDDGRINSADLGAPLAAYCTNDGGIAVWDIDATGQGTLGFTATKADISKALTNAQSSGQNVQVGQGLGNSLYALSSNQLTLVGPEVKEPSKMYEFLTTAAPCA